MVYLKTSEEEYNVEEENKIRLQKRAIRRSRIVAIILGSAGMISIGLGILALVQRQDALNAKGEAEKQKEIATAQADNAQKQRTLAQENAMQALIQKDSADIQRQLAERQTIIAKNNLVEVLTGNAVLHNKSLLKHKNSKNSLKLMPLVHRNSRRLPRRRVRMLNADGCSPLPSRWL